MLVLFLISIFVVTVIFTTCYYYYYHHHHHHSSSHLILSDLHISQHFLQMVTGY